MKKLKKGFQGYVVGTIAFYGPTDMMAIKLAVGIVLREVAYPEPKKKWYTALPSGDVVAAQRALAG